MSNTKKLPCIFARQLVLYPGMHRTMTIGREASKAGVRSAEKDYQSQLVVLTQKDGRDTDPGWGDIYPFGSICRIEKSITLMDEGMQVYMKSLQPFMASELLDEQGVKLACGTVQSTAVFDTEYQETERKQVLTLLNDSMEQIVRDKVRDLIEQAEKSKRAGEFLGDIIELIGKLHLLRSKEELSPGDPFGTAKGQEYAESVNQGIAKRQQILEAATAAEQIKLLRNLIQTELNTARD